MGLDRQNWQPRENYSTRRLVGQVFDEDPQRKSEGLRAFAQSLSTAGLGIAIAHIDFVETMLALPSQIISQQVLQKQRLLRARDQ